jgi:hypothetical protein
MTLRTVTAACALRARDTLVCSPVLVTGRATCGARIDVDSALARLLGRRVIDELRSA